MNLDRPGVKRSQEGPPAWGWRDLPEAEEKRVRPALARRSWVDDLARAWEHDPDTIWRRIYRAVCDGLMDDGMEGFDASRKALRATQAAMLTFEMMLRQNEIAEAQRVTDRTARDDLGHVKSRLADGSVDRLLGRDLPSIPVRDEGRISVGLPSRRRPISGFAARQKHSRGQR